METAEMTMQKDFKSILIDNFVENTEFYTNFEKKRKIAFEDFSAQNFPTTRHEEWKYTNLKNLLANNFHLPVANSKMTLDKIAHFFLPNSEKTNRIVFINGFFAERLSDIKDADLLIKEDSLACFSDDIETKKNIFCALNIALNTTRTTIIINKNVRKPIVAYFIVDATNENIFAQPSIIVRTEAENAQMIAKYDTIGENIAFTNSLEEVILMENAHLMQYKIQNDTPNAHHIHKAYVTHEFGVNNSYTNHTYCLNGGILRNHLNAKINAKGASLNLYGLSLLKGKTHADNRTVADHIQPNCESNEIYKGIYDDKSVGVFNGKIFVRRPAQKTNAYQQSRNILLSDDAAIYAKPQLEIWADDVKCSHGATTGQLDETALFYLRSRGIPEKAAKALLTKAFAGEITEKIEVSFLKTYLEEVIEERMN